MSTPTPTKPLPLFFTAPNLSTHELTEGAPWDFSPDQALLGTLRALPKVQRRAQLLDRRLQWQVYTAVRAQMALSLVSKDNPAVALRGFVADYDLRLGHEEILKLLGNIKEALRPNFVEVSLGQKARLVWVFAREILVSSSEHAAAVWELLAKQTMAETILPGFDKASYKTAERWTNGGQWYDLGLPALAEDICFGLAIEAGKRARILSAGTTTIPLEKIAAEVQKQFPGRWQGEFTLDAVGVRFWDKNADCPSGAQIKPDGMLCFTGSVPFQRWSDIFGRQWMEQQTVLQLGEAGKGLWFDGRQYWEEYNGTWWSKQRQDVTLALKTRGLSDRVPKGATVSDADRVLAHVQTANRVHGAAPLINYRPGLVELRGQRILNTATLRALEPAAQPGEAPWILSFLRGHFAERGDRPLEHFLAWLQRAYTAVRTYTPLMGQALFLCGPKHNGKTLLSLRIVAPLLGSRVADPYQYLTGDTQFNDELFESYLWAINDEDAPRSDAARQKFLARLKASVVNPIHTYHPKFCNKLAVEHCGRLFVTLNDDPASVGLLPEVNSNTADKMSFFASREYGGIWGANTEIEATIAKELPLFAAWLLAWTPPEDILERSRVGVKSYFDPHILEASRQQAYAYNFHELIHSWVRLSGTWTEDGRDSWEGSPTQLMAEVGSCDPLASVAKEWKVSAAAKALTSLARVGDSGVSFVDGSERNFRITKQAFL